MQQQVIFCNEQLLERVMSDFLQQATSTTSNEQILKQATSEFQRVKSNKRKVTPSINYAIPWFFNSICSLVTNGLPEPNFLKVVIKKGD